MSGSDATPPPSDPPRRAGVGQDSARAAFALVVASVVVLLSYMVQRLLDARGAAPMGTIFQQARVPYFWRIALAALHGAGAMLIAGLALSEEEAARWLARAPLLVVPVVLLFVALAVLVP